MRLCHRIMTGIVIVLSGSSLFGQFTLERHDLEKIAGSVGMYAMSGSANPVIDLKDPGPGQIWDFRQIDMGTIIPQRYELTSIAGTAAGEIYPGSNFLMRESDPEDSYWYLNTYVRVTDDSVRIMGRENKSGEQIVFGQSSDTEYYPVPLSYGTTWISVENDTFDWGGGDIRFSTIVDYDTVDAWGTLKLPVGDFEVLRIRHHRNQTSNWGSDFWIRYSFLTKDYLLVALVESQPGETDIHFTNPMYVQYLSTFETAVQQGPIQKGVPGEFRLAQNYPNPFNPETCITFDIPEYSRIELAVYNIQGERIRTLRTGYCHPGTHQTSWDGTDDQGRTVASGLYLYRLMGRNYTETRRMMLIR